MNLEKPDKPLLAALAVVIALILMTAASVVGSSWTSAMAKVEQLAGGGGRAGTGLTAIARTCLDDLGPWPCFQRLEIWGERLTKQADGRLRSGRTPSEFRSDFLEGFVEIVPAPRMLDACPLVRKQECAARMIDFGYSRSITMSLLSKD